MKGPTDMEVRKEFLIETSADLEKFMVELTTAFQKAAPSAWPAIKIMLDPLIHLTRLQLPLPPQVKKMLLIETPLAVRWEEEDDLTGTTVLTAQLPKLA